MGNEKGVTLIELIIVIAIIGILAMIGIPEISRFSADYKVKSAATDLIQNMRVARAMAIKENREYLITFDTANQRYMMGFDGNIDGDLLDLNQDGFGICGCVDADGNGRIEGNERIPTADTDANGDGVPDCVRVVNLRDYGNISFGTLAPIGPDTDGGGPNPPNPLCANGLGVCFGPTANPVRAQFNPPHGSAGNLGSAYFQHVTRGYSYVVIISNTAGAMNMWKWAGDINNQAETNWRELR